MRSGSFAQTGGSLFESPGYQNGSMLPGSGALSVLGGGTSAGASPQPIVVKLDGPATTMLLRGEAVQAMADNPRAVIGHNVSPDPLDDEIHRWVREFGAEIDKRGDELARAKIEDEEAAGRATTLAAIFADIAEAADNKREEIKKPYLTATRKIDSSFKVVIEAAEAAKKKLVSIIDGWRNEQRRIAEEERQRLAQEAAEKAAAAAAAQASGQTFTAARLQAQADAASAAAEAPAVAPRVTSAYGQTAGGRTEWKFMVLERGKLPTHVKNHPDVLKAQDAVIAKLVRGGTRELAGVKIYSEEKTVVRR